MATGENIWDSLPIDEQRSVWVETEGSFWPKFLSLKIAADKENEKYFQLSIRKAQLERSRLKEAKSRLAKDLAKVEAKPADTTGELERIEQDHHASRQKRTESVHDFYVAMRRFFRQKRGEDLDAPDHFGPESEGIVLPEMLLELFPCFNGPTPRVEPANGTSVAADRPEEDHMEVVEHHNNGRDGLVDIVDADGNVIGPLEQIEPWNRWVEGIQELEIRRPVKIRRGRHFTTTHLAGIYERTEAKGVKWLSCMIQKAGAIQAKRCLSCDKNQGVFDDCIIIGGNLFQKCGNCEWNRRGCHGSSGDTIDKLASIKRAQRKKQLEDGAQEASTDRPSETVHQTVEAQPGTEQTTPPEPQLVEGRISFTRPSPLRRFVLERTVREFVESQPERQLDSQIGRQPERHYGQQHGELPEQPTGPQPERRTEHPAEWTTARQPERHPEHQPEEVPDRPNERFHDAIAARLQEGTVEVASTEIAQRPHEILHPSTELDGPARDYRGSGPAHTSREPEQIHTPQDYRTAAGFTPATVRSRPPSSERGRRTPSPMSLDPSSQPPESPPAQPLKEITRETIVLKNDGNVYTYPECVVRVPLVKINEEHPYWEANWPNVKALIEPQLARWREKHQAAIEAGPEQDKGDPSKDQIVRQVNRGIKILEFHEEAPISPYQLLGKRYIQASKGGTTSYETLFHLSETISELEKFNLDISPVDWMRQRLHELIQTQGHNFNLPQTIHGFYHDSKLTSLRHKNRVKNIGCPSGAMKARLSNGSPCNTPKLLQKRKSLHSTPTTPQEDSFRNHSPLPDQIPPSYPTSVPAPVTAPSPQPTFGTHLNKKPKCMPPAQRNPAHD